MKRKSFFLVMFMGLALGFTGCSDEEGEYTGGVFDNLPADSGTEPTETQMSAAVTQFVNAVVIPTYNELVTKMTALNSAVAKFETSGLQADMDAACDAWRAARVPWEQSEAFLYGPADLKKYDPSLDSWPLDKDGIDAIIASGDFDKVGGDVNEDEEAVDAPQNLRGFHTAEKILFADGQNRKVTDLVANEKEYLSVVVKRMLSDVTNMRNGWTVGLGNSDSEVPTSYGDAMKAHDGTSSYASLNSVYAAIELMLNGDNGMAGISNEVGTAKIKDPVDAWNGSNKNANDPNNPGVLAVESWYSWNSLVDFVDNIKSIRNAYYGSTDGTVNTNSLSKLVEVINPELDKRMKDQIDRTMTAINDIPAPFRNNLGAATEINAAMSACVELTKGLDIVRAKFAK